MKIITSREMIRLDNESPVPAELLMERAGCGLAEFIYNNMPCRPVIFICGSGNNGGDGFVAARYLIEKGMKVRVFCTKPLNELQGLPKNQAEKLSIKLEAAEPELLSFALDTDVITVDCILGTGFKGPLRDSIKALLDVINDKSRLCIACDMPSGVDGDTGDADESALDADQTVTFAYPKLGHLNGKGSRLSGSIEVVDIGIAQEPEKYLDATEFICREDCRSYFKRREKKSHKKTYGHVVVVGGSTGMEGAPALAALGAQRSGAGLVTCAVPASISSTVSSYSMSCMTLALEDAGSGILGPGSAEQIMEFIEERKVDSIVIGPGLRNSARPSELVKELLIKVDVPIVIDADALNCLDEMMLKKLGEYRKRILMTPHPGEMGRLIGIDAAEVQRNRTAASVELSRKSASVVILKGYRSLVTDAARFYVNTTGNAGMASGGSGDVLSGIAAALMAEGMDIMDSARTACWVHGRAGDIASWNIGQRALTAEDIIDNLSRVR